MNRTIKFRVWDVDNKKMYHPCEENDYMILFGDTGFFTVQYHANYDIRKDKYKDLSVVDTLENNLALMQFTGLKDKNGKEIYEGDILKDYKDENNPIGVVYYYAPQFVVQTIEDIPYALAEGKVNMGQLEYTEVIGNIYEHPHLIEKGE